MENEQKTRFYKKKAFLVPLCLLLAGFVVYAAASSFHSYTAQLDISEGRSSSDLPVTLAGFSGETINWTATLNNDARVPLNAVINITETANPDGVDYSCTDPGVITIPALGSIEVTPTCTISNTTNQGTVNLTINYVAVE